MPVSLRALGWGGIDCIGCYVDQQTSNHGYLGTGAWEFANRRESERRTLLCTILYFSFANGRVGIICSEKKKISRDMIGCHQSRQKVSSMSSRCSVDASGSGTRHSTVEVI